MRTKVILRTVFSIVIIFGAFFALRVSSPDIKTETSKPPFDTSEKQSSELPQKTYDTKYLITLEGKELCAYKESDGTRELAFSRLAEPMLMSDEDREKLKNGIYAESYEDLCLYFEAYLS